MGEPKVESASTEPVPLKLKDADPKDIAQVLRWKLTSGPDETPWSFRYSNFPDRLFMSMYIDPDNSSLSVEITEGDLKQKRYFRALEVDSVTLDVNNEIVVFNGPKSELMLKNGGRQIEGRGDVVFGWEHLYDVEK